MHAKGMLAAVVIAGVVCLSLPARVWTQSGKLATSRAAQPTAEQVYKNIQVLQGIPADQLIPAMQFVTTSLGVQCDFCHQENAFERDDKETKQTARKMMRMMLAINKDNFDGHREVTCYACHRGQRKPVITPIIRDENNPAAAGEKPSYADSINASKDATSKDASLPSADQIVGKYLQAVGGAEAAARISTRIQKGTLTVGSQQFPVEVLARSPSKRVTTVHFPGGDSVTSVSGDEGWLITPGRPVHDMTTAEVDAAKMDAELFFPATLRQLFKELRVERQDQVDGRDAYVVLGMRDNQPPVQLYFDQESGLLVRVLRYTETPLGENPTQIDYADYRSEGGVKTPFRWTVARPGGRFTIQAEQMQQSVPIQDEKFGKPIP